MIEIVTYDPTWPARFAAVAADLRSALGDVAMRIDHIGSTAVPGLAAKPVVDIQISVTLKRDLAQRHRDDRRAYTDAKVPYVWETIRRADEWAQASGWIPPPSDA